MTRRRPPAALFPDHLLVLRYVRLLRGRRRPGIRGVKALEQLGRDTFGCGPETLSRLHILAVSWAFPPMNYPRSIQVSRLLDALDATVVVLCGSEKAGVSPYQSDHTISPGIDFRLGRVIREPFHRRRALYYVDAVANRCHIPWSSLPDTKRKWTGRLLKRARTFQREAGYTPDLLLTFGEPMSDHLFGAAYKQRTGIPWIAHFSDPWADSPYRPRAALTTWLTRRMERQVVAKADAVLFTSPETLELVMSKYPPAWRHKASYLPHSFDASRFDNSLTPPKGPYIMRFVGRLYGHRSARPLFEALDSIAHSDPALLANLVVDLVGPIEPSPTLIETHPLVQQVVRFSGAVSYAESLRLIQTAHCLLVIDAPADFSVFFPSKLSDYIGARRFIVALSPEGTTARIVRELGGLVANPSSLTDTVHVLKTVLALRPDTLPRAAIQQYERQAVAKEMMEIAGRVLGKTQEGIATAPGSQDLSGVSTED